ncbi:MAG: peptide chain release factor N(5)-glutamine methyltransferase [Burkholderiaceae bacterium]|nr:peptide chain release factor N(5)-glutamine methyltransferase [Burkholderiaceae bacterium]
MPDATVRALVAASGLPALDARLLLAEVLGVSRERLVAFPEQLVAADAVVRFEALAARGRRGEPLAYLLGRREFYGRAFNVSPAVLVPRPESELLVDLALEALRGHAAPRVLDLGTGSGCIAITLALARSDAEVVATDVSAAALAVARANAQALGASLRWVASDWYEALAGHFDLIVSNPPYVAAGDPHLAALACEPIDALTDHADGLDCLRRIVAGAPAHLRPGGWLLVEHGYDQGARVRQLLADAGLQGVRTVRDIAGHERVGIAQSAGEARSGDRAG